MSRYHFDGEWFAEMRRMVLSRPLGHPDQARPMKQHEAAPLRLIPPVALTRTGGRWWIACGRSCGGQRKWS